MRHGITACICLALLTTSVTSFAQRRSFVLVDDGQSPSKRYAVAWGLASRKLIDVKKAETRNPTYLWDLTDAKPVQVYVIDQKTHSIIRTLKGADYSPADRHAYLDVDWDPHERFAVVTCQNKWHSRSSIVVTVPASGMAMQKDLLPAVEKSLLAEIKRVGVNDHPKLSQGRDDLGSETKVTLSVLRPRGDLEFQVLRHCPAAEQPYIFEGRMQCVVNLNGGKLTVTPGPIHSIEDKNWRLESVYTGVIGQKLKVEMRLWDEPVYDRGDKDTQILGQFAEFRTIGSYYYLSDHQPLKLSEPTREPASRPDPKLRLVEVDKGKVTGRFEGEFDGNGSFSGIWTSGDGKRSLPFRLERKSCGWVRR